MPEAISSERANHVPVQADSALKLSTGVEVGSGGNPDLARVAPFGAHIMAAPNGGFLSAER